MNLCSKSGDKSRAVQTLRDHGAQPDGAKRLDCARLQRRFSGGNHWAIQGFNARTLPGAILTRNLGVLPCVSPAVPTGMVSAGETHGSTLLAIASTVVQRFKPQTLIGAILSPSDGVMG